MPNNLVPPVFVTNLETDPAQGGSPLQVVPAMTSSGNLSVSTGASYTEFASAPCKQLTLANNSGVTINVQQGGEGASLPVFAGTYFTLLGLSNANQIAVSRADGTATAVTVNARWEA